MGHELRIEKCKRGVPWVCCFNSEEMFPVAKDILLHQTLECLLWDWRMKLLERMWKVILTTMFLNLKDPRFSWWNIRAEQVSGKFMRGTVRKP